ncbi:hypothetical protein CATYP_04460 [Corynebacterium atypicum]|uniref:D-aminoacyl-tRNA deacylase n=1 Tax=Corynebacterium atypicum TaxID=191610 RepID=A0ABM5QMN0_9CORY|nr:D-aminoacyl-tRNA deacylase [Corynebacterium atypicum]AIG64026.1 hypothetical protein CATYP_04460 [Corynebacterium atypicum]
MKAVLTRVTQARVTVDDEVVGELTHPGVLALVGVHREDGQKDAETMARKIAQLRILHEETSAVDVGAPVLVVSQFTLQGRTKKGRRPSWSDAAPGPEAERLIAEVVSALRGFGLEVSEGRFGATMQVASVNDGPFTVLVDTRD